MAEEFETNVEITKVYEGKSGEGEYGPWTAYNFYVKDDERKFSWFKSDSRPIMPVRGMQIKLMEYVVKQSGEYTNYNVSRIVLHGDAHKKAETFEPPHKPVPVPIKQTGRDSSLTMYISYAKDTILKMVDTNPDPFKGLTVNQMADMIVDVGLQMYDRAHGMDEPTTVAQKEIEKGFVDDEPRQEPDFPEDRFPPPHGE